MTSAAPQAADDLVRLRRGESRRVAAFHLVDHLRRLVGRLEQRERASIARRHPTLRKRADALADALSAPEAGATFEALATGFADDRQRFRHETLRGIGREPAAAERALAAMDVWRWLERIAHHAWRATHHLERLRTVHPAEPEAEPAAQEPPGFANAGVRLGWRRGT